MSDLFLSELKKKFQIKNISSEESSISLEIEIPRFSNKMLLFYLMILKPIINEPNNLSWIQWILLSPILIPYK